MNKENLIYMCVYIIESLNEMYQNGKINEEAYHEEIHMKIRFLTDYCSHYDIVKTYLSEIMPAKIHRDVYD